MLLTVSVPEDVVGDVIGDLNSRRGKPLGMEAKGSATEVKAEVPMAEVLDYAPDLRAITGGRGDYTMEFAHHEEIPSHLAQKVISEANARKRKSRPEGHRQRGRRRRGETPGPPRSPPSPPTRRARSLAERSETIGEATNNVAEYRALLLGHRARRASSAPTRSSSIGDSALIAHQVRGEWKVKQEHLRPLRTKVRRRAARASSSGRSATSRASRTSAPTSS